MVRPFGNISYILEANFEEVCFQERARDQNIVLRAIEVQPAEIASAPRVISGGLAWSPASGIELVSEDTYE